MNLSRIALIVVVAAAALVPMGAGAEPRPPELPPEPQGTLTITTAMADVHQGSDVQPKGTVGTNGNGSSPGVGRWQTESLVRRITDVFGRVFADNLARTSLLDSVPFSVSVGADIWLNGTKTYSCGATNFGQKVASCETQDVRIPGNVRGTGRHSYETTSGVTSLGTTDTGTRYLQ